MGLIRWRPHFLVNHIVIRSPLWCTRKSYYLKYCHYLGDEIAILILVWCLTARWTGSHSLQFTPELPPFFFSSPQGKGNKGFSSPSNWAWWCQLSSPFVSRYCCFIRRTLWLECISLWGIVSSPILLSATIEAGWRSSSVFVSKCGGSRRRNQTVKAHIEILSTPFRDNKGSNVSNFYACMPTLCI